MAFQEIKLSDIVNQREYKIEQDDSDLDEMFDSDLTEKLLKLDSMKQISKLSSKTDIKESDIPSEIVEEVEESVAVNTLGTIIHEALEELYEPFVGIYLAEHHIETMLSKTEEVTLKQFKIVYKEGEIRKGKNLLAFEVAKRNIYNFLMSEKKAIQNNDAIKVMYLEAPLEVIIEHEDLPYPIKIAGKVDRIEERNGSIRIIDYKSGKVEQRHLRINDFDGLTTSLKNEKVIQLLCYAMMFQNSEMFQNQDIQAGIISFKNMKEGFMSFGLGKGKNAIPEINSETGCSTCKRVFISKK